MIEISSDMATYLKTTPDARFAARGEILRDNSRVSSKQQTAAFYRNLFRSFRGRFIQYLRLLSAEPLRQIALNLDN